MSVEEQYVVIRGFTTEGRSYRKGDSYCGIDRERIQLLRRHGLIAPAGETEKGGGEHGRDGCEVPQVRGD